MIPIFFKSVTLIDGEEEMIKKTIVTDNHNEGSCSLSYNICSDAMYAHTSIHTTSRKFSLIYCNDAVEVNTIKKRYAT